MNSKTGNYKPDAPKGVKVRFKPGDMLVYTEEIYLNIGENLLKEKTVLKFFYIIII
jgi:hypothetical protein